MYISKMEAWICKQKQPSQITKGERHPCLTDGQANVILIRITDSDGIEGIGTCLAEKNVNASFSYYFETIFPILNGKEVNDRERIWYELWAADRYFSFFPLHIIGPVDVALWDIAAKRAGLPLYKYIGAYRNYLPVYYSSAFLQSVDDYIKDIDRCISLGIKAYKVHCRDNPEIFEAIREKVGHDFVLIAEPVSDWSIERAYSIGKILENNNYYWLEEPFRDYNIYKYIELKKKLNIPIAGTEALYGGPWAVSQFISSRAVDIVRADVSWKAGITGALKTANLAEAFGLNCEIHMSVMGPMDIANLHVSCAIKNCEFFELSSNYHAFQFPMKDPYPITNDGKILVPNKPGLGIDIDWDTVSNKTYRKFEIKN